MCVCDNKKLRRDPAKYDQDLNCVLDTAGKLFCLSGLVVTLAPSDRHLISEQEKSQIHVSSEKEGTALATPPFYQI